MEITDDNPKFLQSQVYKAKPLGQPKTTYSFCYTTLSGVKYTTGDHTIYYLTGYGAKRGSETFFKDHQGYKDYYDFKYCVPYSFLE